MISGLGLIAVLFTPMWRIDLDAPQYPEGLRMLIYANKLAGNVDIINGLNHYIGMKTLHADDFPEFTILPYIIVFFSFSFIAVGWLARRRGLYLLCILFLAFGVLAMVDFWRWEYDYGHNLNPDAAIIVPGMAYQPPLIGFKQLLNFGAYSMPDTGGWIFVTVGVLLLGAVFYEWKRGKKTRFQIAGIPILVMSVFMMMLMGCQTGPKPINMGKDYCDFCKMTISDNRFGAEIITKKTKIYKFDDAHCIRNFLLEHRVKQEEVAAIYFTDFSSPHQLIPIENAIFFHSEELKSPMNGNIAVFSAEDSLKSVSVKFKGNKISWEEVKK